MDDVRSLVNLLDEHDEVTAERVLKIAIAGFAGKVD
jgi:hypothetical protein